MSEALLAINDGRAMGRVDYADDKMTFRTANRDCLALGSAARSIQDDR